MWTWKFPPYGSQAGEWTLEGGLLDYGPYLEEFGPNLLNLYSEKDLKAGSFYGQQVGFRRLQTTNQWSVQTFIRQDYLDVLGLEQPRTIDEVYELAVTLKANADKLGQDPETFFPIQPRSLQWIPHRYLLSAFLDETPGPERMVVPWQMWPEAKDAARWLNKLYNEGLAADLTVDRTMHGQMVINGQTAIIPWLMHSPIFVGYGDFYNKMVQNNPDAKLEPIYPWTKDTSLPYWNELFGNPGYGLGFITPSNTKHPQQVVQYLDYLASDLGRQTMILGVEGQDWEKTADGGFRRLISPQEVTDRIAWIQAAVGSAESGVSRQRGAQWAGAVRNPVPRRRVRGMGTLRGAELPRASGAGGEPAGSGTEPFVGRDQRRLEQRAAEDPGRFSGGVRRDLGRRRQGVPRQRRRRRRRGGGRQLRAVGVAIARRNNECSNARVTTDELRRRAGGGGGTVPPPPRRGPDSDRHCGTTTFRSA